MKSNSNKNISPSPSYKISESSLLELEGTFQKVIQTELKDFFFLNNNRTEKQQKNELIGYLFPKNLEAN